MLINVEAAEGIATLTLNRPEKLNALSFAMLDELMRALDEIEEDETVRALIITGAGDRAFSAGADITDLAASMELGSKNGRGPAAAIREVRKRGQGMTQRIENFSKPVIAAVNGIAFGGGCELLEATHMAIASERASFGKPEISLGFPPPFGGTQRLPRHIGRKRALELILTGDPIPASRALEIGLVNHVVDHDRLLGEARALAARITRHSADAVTACLAAVTRGLNMSIDEGLATEAVWFALCLPTEGVQQGLSRFLTRRPGEPAQERTLAQDRT